MSDYVLSPAWSETNERAFRRLVAGLIVATLIGSVVVSFIRLPEVAREVAEAVPERFASILLPKPEPVVIPEPAKPEQAVEQPKDAEKKIPEEKKPEQPKPQTVTEAREKAKKAGILAFRDKLADMRESVDATALAKMSAVTRGAGEATQVDRSLLTASKGGKAASVDVASLSRETGGVALSGPETTEVDFEEEVASAAPGRGGAAIDERARSIEEVRRVFDANKGAIYSIYNRALRSNPALAGKVVLELVIEPDGHV
ncbi:MAG: hypothetical protein KDI19_02370, partial [Pseudomonadales bacterium]|nr:hypothetical protein [Pseudomonadales bacterium]